MRALTTLGRCLEITRTTTTEGRGRVPWSGILCTTQIGTLCCYCFGGGFASPGFRVICEKRKQLLILWESHCKGKEIEIAEMWMWNALSCASWNLCWCTYLPTIIIQLPCLLLFQTIVVRDLAQDYYWILFLDYCHDVWGRSVNVRHSWDVDASAI